MSAAHDYSDLHQLIDRMEPDQVDELRQHALRLIAPPAGRFTVLRTFDGPATDLGARAREIIRTEIGEAAALPRLVPRSLIRTDQGHLLSEWDGLASDAGCL